MGLLFLVKGLNLLLIYMSFNYFEGNKRVYYCFNPTGKEWDIFYWWCYKKYDTDLDISIIDVKES